MREKILRFANVSAAARACPRRRRRWSIREGGERRRIDLAALAAMPTASCSRAIETYDPPTLPLDAKGQGKPYAVYGYGAQIAELEVDMRLGTVKLIKITAAHDVGKAINPLLVEGQIEGGIAQGIGMALMEEYVPGRTENLHDYLIPTIGDVPPIETILVEVAGSGRALRRQGAGRARADPDRAGDHQRHPPCDRRAGDQDPGDADPRAGGDQEGGGAAMSELAERFETHDAGAKQVGEKIRCDACPVMCYIADGRTGACDRYGNRDGRIVRLDPLTILEHAAATGDAVVPFAGEADIGTASWSTAGASSPAIGAGTTYPDYKPAPFIVSQEVEGVDLVTVVTEGIFSYCGVKVKIDTDRHLGPETATVRAARRGGRPCHHRRIRLADAVARRRASPDRRLEVRRPRHLRNDCSTCATASRSSCRSTAAPPSSSRPASRR